MTITGANLANATAVDFGTTAASSFTSDSTTQITADSPAGTGTVDVTVTTAGGTSATSSADQFHLRRRTDGHGPEPDDRSARRAARLVTITGTGFTGATAVDFGTTAATSFTSDSTTQITADSPAGHRHRGRDRDHRGRDVGHVVRRSVHLRGRTDGLGPEPDHRSAGGRHVW